MSEWHTDDCKDFDHCEGACHRCPCCERENNDCKCVRSLTPPNKAQGLTSEWAERQAERMGFDG